MNDLEKRLIQLLDWVTRNLKHLQKKYPYTQKDVETAIYLFGRIYAYCDALGVNPLKWCKKVKIPYYSYYSQENYSKFFTSTTPFNPKGNPMQKAGTYEELIKLTIKECQQDL